MGALAYADDLALLAPDRLTLQRMVTVCEEYLVFSTDSDPNKSKTKCVAFTGTNREIVHPAPIILDGERLPWGHVLHQSLSMEADSVRARACFMSRASDIRDNLYFSHPEQRIQAIQLYCCDGFGAMLWDLSAGYSESFFKAWNVQARLAWHVPRETHTNLVEHFFCEGKMSLRNQILSRYHNFVRKLGDSPSKEIRFMFNLNNTDRRSVTGRNIEYLSRLCNNCNVMNVGNEIVKSLLPTATPCEPWRISLLVTLLGARL